MGGQAITRQAFINAILGIIPEASIRFMHVPKGGDGTTSIDLSPNEFTITWDATIAGRLTPLGNGLTQSYDGSTNFGRVADAAPLTYGNGITDIAMSGMVLVNVTDTANGREIIGKFEVVGSGIREYKLSITTANLMQFSSWDKTNTIGATRISNSAIPQGSYHLFAFTYDGSGGVTAANGMTLYQDAAVIASTATNNALYIANGDSATDFTIGSILSSNAAATFFQGSMAFELMCQGVLTAAQLLAAKTLVNKYFRLTL